MTAPGSQEKAAEKAASAAPAEPVVAVPPPAGERRRLRDLGFPIGRYPTGPLNAITDVAGVRVGHTTLVQGEGPLLVGKGPVRTGVTAIVPFGDEKIFHERALGGAFVLNGAGEVSGLTQVVEWGLLETPILLTNTLSVGKVSDATVKWLTKRTPGIGNEYDVVIPVVGECDDSFLNDAVGRHIRSEHVYKAIEGARDGKVEEGAVGAGTGMVTCDFKAGIGTSSRQVHTEGKSYTLGVLVLSNFGVMRNLRIDGVPVGEILEPDYRHYLKRLYSYGSIITVIATDAPLMTSQLNRLCKRAALGIGRVGSYAAHGSGEIVVGFSTANRVPRVGDGLTHQIEVLFDRGIGPLYEAVIEATEEAIVNSLCMADTMVGHSGNQAPGLPLDKTVEVLTKYRPVLPDPRSTQPAL